MSRQWGFTTYVTQIRGTPSPDNYMYHLQTHIDSGKGKLLNTKWIQLRAFVLAVVGDWMCANTQELQQVTCMGTSTCTDLHHKLYQGHWKKARREMNKMALNVSRSLLPLVFPSSPLAYVNHSNASTDSESSPLGYCYQHPRKQNRTRGEVGKAWRIMGDVEGVDPWVLFLRPKYVSEHGHWRTSSIKVVSARLRSDAVWCGTCLTTFLPFSDYKKIGGGRFVTITTMATKDTIFWHATLCILAEVIATFRSNVLSPSLDRRSKQWE